MLEFLVYFDSNSLEILKVTKYMIWAKNSFGLCILGLLLIWYLHFGSS